ncbi:MAG: undecaprenyl/decaprenyl-phosphate alpha-N-acetylglucosaminyl 1-phosphate transferase [Ardenticatenaceae bacterium]|nr:undecaprenyl/decaprenyl-phosphate alpha-N-acetylglucosaminyl 1-phosphate transferase [Ardenticatenaceae bacterium]HBY99515.1 undecaprenyl/decaprenyl-phosphate alpha-N-acetylglucosaminyl 1-phosphate transferase [Chloroflexota bacterium]
MSTLLLIFAAALVMAAGGTPVARRLALRLGVIDQPNARKIHLDPIPLLGGLAIYAAVIGALVLFGARAEVNQLAAILIGASWISFFGFWDDHQGLGAGTKLLAQAGAALILIVGGVMVRLPLPAWVNWAITLFWVVGITNAFNLLDNMDGLSGGLGAVAAAFFLLLAAISGQYLVGGLAAALLGACLGFLIYNFNPARIFMGDTGSLFLGFLMAALGIKMRFPSNVPWVTWMIPLLVLGVPIFDTTLVFFSRLRRGKNPLTTPGKDHVSHRLVQRGWTRREAVLLLYLTGCALGAIAIFVAVADRLAAYTVGVIVAATALAGLVELEQRYTNDERRSISEGESRPI